jgi:hypothetical protein
MRKDVLLTILLLTLIFSMHADLGQAVFLEKTEKNSTFPGPLCKMTLLGTGQG